MSERERANRQKLLRQLKTVEQLARGGKLRRLLYAPVSYLETGWFNKVVYPRQQQPKKVRAKTFYGLSFRVGLPAGTDIFLTGGKTHPSEIQLSRFMIRHFKPDDHYVDVGGHYGFFGGLARAILDAGAVDVIEPSPDTFKYLQENLGGVKANLHQKGMANLEGKLTFYQFPALYSEYNSLDVEQYQGESWFKNYPPEAVEVAISTLDESFPTSPEWLKIDVEGAEDLVIQGGKRILSLGKTVISMEYLPAGLSNGSHGNARKLLAEMGYTTYRLDDEGSPIVCRDPEAYLRAEQLDSTNLIFALSPPEAVI